MVTANSLTSISVVDGYNITLSCNSSGSPPDTFTWMKDGDPTLLQSTDIITITHTNTSAVFSINYTISNFSISNVGTYKCTVSNPIGSDDYSLPIDLRKLSCVVTILCMYTPLQKGLSWIV